MYKVMMEILDYRGNAFERAADFDTEDLAWSWWYGKANQYPEMVGIWVENQTITDKFGAEAAANVMGCGDES